MKKFWILILSIFLITCTSPIDPIPEPTLPTILTGTANISGIAQSGQTLTGSITGSNGTGTIAYEWKSGGIVVGSNAATYTLVAGDVGKIITVKISYSDMNGSISASKGPVVAAGSPPPPPTLISYNASQIGGSEDAADTTAIKLDFSSTPPDLNNISITNTEYITTGTKTISGNSVTIPITFNYFSNGHAVIRVNEDGYETIASNSWDYLEYGIYVYMKYDNPSDTTIKVTKDLDLTLKVPNPYTSKITTFNADEYYVENITYDDNGVRTVVRIEIEPKDGFNLGGLRFTYTGAHGINYSNEIITITFLPPPPPPEIPYEWTYYIFFYPNYTPSKVDDKVVIEYVLGPGFTAAEIDPTSAFVLHIGSRTVTLEDAHLSIYGDRFQMSYNFVTEDIGDRRLRLEITRTGNEVVLYKEYDITVIPKPIEPVKIFEVTTDANIPPQVGDTLTAHLNYNVTPTSWKWERSDNGSSWNYEESGQTLELLARHLNKYIRASAIIDGVTYISERTEKVAKAFLVGYVRIEPIDSNNSGYVDTGDSFRAVYVGNAQNPIFTWSTGHGEYIGQVYQSTASDGVWDYGPGTLRVWVTSNEELDKWFIDFRGNWVYGVTASFSGIGINWSEVQVEILDFEGNKIIPNSYPTTPSEALSAKVKVGQTIYARVFNSARQNIQNLKSLTYTWRDKHDHNKIIATTSSPSLELPESSFRSDIAVEVSGDTILLPIVSTNHTGYVRDILRATLAAGPLVVSEQIGTTRKYRINTWGLYYSNVTRRSDDGSYILPYVGGQYNNTMYPELGIPVVEWYIEDNNRTLLTEATWADNSWSAFIGTRYRKYEISMANGSWTSWDKHLIGRNVYFHVVVPGVEGELWSEMYKIYDIDDIGLPFNVTIYDL
jgi:hypothetical protein